jgi:hypothetical protein
MNKRNIKHLSHHYNDDVAFLAYCSQARKDFVKSYWSHYGKDSKLRVICEDILIAYDQMHSALSAHLTNQQLTADK